MIKQRLLSIRMEVYACTMEGNFTQQPSMGEIDNEELELKNVTYRTVECESKLTFARCPEQSKKRATVSCKYL